MASTRAERRQQRVRGAGLHQVGDIEFGALFPDTFKGSSPAREILETSDLPSQEILQSTPATARRQRNDSPEVSTNLRDENQGTARSSAKRRRINEELPISTRSTRSTSHLVSPKERTDVSQSQSQLEELQSTNYDQISPSVAVQSIRRGSLRPVTFRQEEVTEIPRSAPGSGRRQTVDTKSAAESGDVLQDVSSSSPPAKLQSSPLAARDSTARRSARLSESERQSEASPELFQDTPRSFIRADILEEVDELSPEQPSREVASFSDEPEQDEAESIADKQTAQTFGRKGRQEEKDEEENSEREVEREAPQRSEPQGKNKRRQVNSPASQRQPKRPRGRPPGSRNSSRGKLRRGSPIPVTVHRLTQVQPLFDEDNPGADILNAPIPYAKRGGVNTADVLSQVCDEIIASGLAALEEALENSDVKGARREYRTKLRAIEAFQGELSTRLLELAIGLDNSYALVHRVRDAQKRKIELREELLEIRRQREKIAIRKDEVRIRHERESNEADTKQKLNVAITDMALAIARGRQSSPVNQPEGDEHIVPPSILRLESKLRDTAALVSSKSEDGGLLRRVKEFNQSLERAAAALEGRTFS